MKAPLNPGGKRNWPLPLCGCMGYKNLEGKSMFFPWFCPLALIWYNNLIVYLFMTVKIYCVHLFIIYFILSVQTVQLAVFGLFIRKKPHAAFKWVLKDVASA